MKFSTHAAALLLASTVIASPARFKRSCEGEKCGVYARGEQGNLAGRGLELEGGSGREKRALRAARTVVTTKSTLRAPRTVAATTAKALTTTVKPTTTTSKTTTTTSRTTVTTTKSTTTTSKPASTTSKAITTTSKPSTTSSSKTSAAAAATTPAKLTSSKKGVGYNTASYLTGFSNLNSLAWAYNWASTETHANQPLLAPAVDFVPMLWGSNTDGWASAAQAAIDGGAKYLLGFNEPDLDSQSNINATEAARIWKLSMEPFAGKAKLISPAITNGGSPMGVQWMCDFLAACTGCHIDGIAMHIYDGAWNTGYFTSYLTSTYNEFKKPIWLTEFAGYGTVAEQQAFFKYLLPWMEQQAFIFRYAAFGAFEGTFNYANGTLTPLGLTYAQTV